VMTAGKPISRYAARVVHRMLLPSSRNNHMQFVPMTPKRRFPPPGRE
jgi:hypothetical protein